MAVAKSSKDVVAKSIIGKTLMKKIIVSVLVLMSFSGAQITIQDTTELMNLSMQDASNWGYNYDSLAYASDDKQIQMTMFGQLSFLLTDDLTLITGLRGSKCEDSPQNTF